MSKKEDEQMTDSGHDDPEDLEPDVAPERTSSSDVPSSGAAAPRMARYGEGPEGRAARRERGQVAPRQGFFGRIGTFVHDVRAELGRVTWPTAIQVRNTTIITIVAVVFFAVYLFFVDWGLTKLIEGVQWAVNRIFGGA